jgi:hypothetical protein
MDLALCGMASMSQNDRKNRMKSLPSKRRVPGNSGFTSLSIDLAKQVFHLVGMDAHGTLGVHKRLDRAQMLTFIAPLSPTLLGMETCDGAHDWARRLREHGHAGRLMAP